MYERHELDYCGNCGCIGLSGYRMTTDSHANCSDDAVRTLTSDESERYVNVGAVAFHAESRAVPA